jgi:hypothetical protein
MPERSQENMIRTFQEIYEGLCLSNESYDKGFVGEAKRIAVVIRVLVHDTDSSKSLLRQLRKKDMPFYSTPDPYSPGNLLSEYLGLFVRMSIVNDSPVMTYEPILDDLPPERRWAQFPFKKWWEEQRMIRDQKRVVFTRKDLVLELANKAGGAHVDPKITHKYEELSYNNSIGVRMLSSLPKESTFPEHGPEYAALRQIGHEVQKTLEAHCSDLLKR